MTTSTTRPSCKTLFLGTSNASRSFMAEHLLRQIGRGRFEVCSAGLVSSDRPHPMALRVLRDYFKIAVGQTRSVSIYEYDTSAFDLVITLSEEAQQSVWPWEPRTVVVHWSTRNPAAAGTRANAFRSFRDVGLQLHRRIGLLCSLPLDSLDGLRFPKSQNAFRSPDAALAGPA